MTQMNTLDLRGLGEGSWNIEKEGFNILFVDNEGKLRRDLNE